MTLAIAQLGQPVLRRVAEPIPLDVIPTPEFQRFLEAMRITLREAGGVGLAAPQVFVSNRVFLAMIEPIGEDEQLPEPEVFINPTLTPIGDEMTAAWEGCLSFPELKVLVPRHRRLRVEYLNHFGEQKTVKLEDFPARVVQHENDHLDGILTIDRAVTTRDIVKSSEIEAVLRHRARLDEPGRQES